jgi:PleD family two-component response regulator
MDDSADKRQDADRRRRPRGGRRTVDAHGFTPLVMVVDGHSSRRDVSEAILAKLRFAVVPVESVERAASIIRALRPEIIVASVEDARKLRSLTSSDDRIPIVAVAEEARVTEALIDQVRQALREPSQV